MNCWCYGSQMRHVNLVKRWRWCWCITVKGTFATGPWFHCRTSILKIKYSSTKVLVFFGDSSTRRLCAGSRTHPDRHVCFRGGVELTNEAMCHFRPGSQSVTKRSLVWYRVDTTINARTRVELIIHAVRVCSTDSEANCSFVLSFNSEWSGRTRSTLLAVVAFSPDSSIRLEYNCLWNTLPLRSRSALELPHFRPADSSDWTFMLWWVSVQCFFSGKKCVVFKSARVNCAAFHGVSSKTYNNFAKWENWENCCGIIDSMCFVCQKSILWWRVFRGMLLPKQFIAMKVIVSEHVKTKPCLQLFQSAVV